MNNPHMLYRCPGPHRTDGVDYDYTVVDASEIDARLAEGWHLHFLDAHAAARQADADKLAANEAEQAAIAQQLQAQPKTTRKAKS